jgi:hypothetical protein
VNINSITKNDYLMGLFLWSVLKKGRTNLERPIDEPETFFADSLQDDSAVAQEDGGHLSISVATCG